MKKQIIGIPSRPATMLTMMITAVWLIFEVFDITNTIMLIRQSIKDISTDAKNIIK
jgi:hypothetical protein